MTFSIAPRMFNDEQAAAEFKSELIERFCRDEVSSATVAIIFAQSQILKRS
jgi:hypothetical protein